ncbi:hypothetical protein [Metallibacterium sp.]
MPNTTITLSRITSGALAMTWPGVRNQACVNQCMHLRGAIGNTMLRLRPERHYRATKAQRKTD